MRKFPQAAQEVEEAEEVEQIEEVEEERRGLMMDSQLKTAPITAQLDSITNTVTE